MSIQLHIEIFRASTHLGKYTYTFNLNDSVLSVKERIHTDHGYAVAFQNLHTLKEKMENTQTLAHYNIKDGDRIYDLLVG